MSERTTNQANIKLSIDILACQYNPNYDYLPDQPNFNYIDKNLLDIISKLAYELSIVQQRVYDLEHPNQDELTNLLIPKKR